jgi:hypothetical protein
LFGPRITIFTNDGHSFTKEGTGREFIWDFEELVRRIRRRSTMVLSSIILNSWS